MEILRGLDGLRSLPASAVLSIGNFDGLHLGHQRILRHARELCGNCPLAVATFEPHPLTVLRPQSAPARLSSMPQKESLLRSAGVTHLVILPPDPDILNLEAEQFWSLLRDHVRPAFLVEGKSFTFGKARRGDVHQLRQWSAGSSTTVEIIDPVTVTLTDLTVVPVSSSLIRFLVTHGRARDAAVALGRPYELQGEVIQGHQRGRTIGVPTANLRCHQLVPADGVYAGRSTVNGATYPSALSVGTMPTFGEHQRQVEVHLLGFSGDLYGQTLTVQLLDWVRDQRKFHTLDALKARMKVDFEMVMDAETRLREVRGV